MHGIASSKFVYEESPVSRSVLSGTEVNSVVQNTLAPWCLESAMNNSRRITIIGVFIIHWLA
jgi:hypothetical protein